MSFMFCGLYAISAMLNCSWGVNEVTPVLVGGNELLWKTHLVCVWGFKFCFLAFRVYILVAHSSAMEIRPDGCDNQPFRKLHTHYILENQCTYVCLDVLICWIIFVSSKWLEFQWNSYLECQLENSSRWRNWANLSNRSEYRDRRKVTAFFSLVFLHSTLH
jgi:hypothetical protein